jgi:thiamine biosynthesis lipoprotein
VGPLVSLWGFNNDNPRLPSQEEINEVLPFVNWRNIELDAQTNSVFLTQQGMTIDLGAIAKGYAADEAARIAKEAGIKRARIDLGGNIIMLGERRDKTPWRVGIQSPGEDRGTVAGVLQITNKTIVTSGIYERYFEKDGKHYHHLFSPSQGYPVENGLLSVTIIIDISQTNASMDADALSTAVFVLGYDAGLALLEYFSDTEAVFIFEDRSIRTTPGAAFTNRAW